jgi:hypothetical protein
MKLRDDKYRKVRGGKAKVIAICCSNCHKKVIEYQKDGVGPLHRCYANRVVSPVEFANIVNAILVESLLPILKCLECNQIIGYPTTHSDKRLAWNLILGKWEKQSI